ncbi:DNA-binding transcriptional activator of the SARP family [Devosia sp. YR412]|uniref:AfsR/SARP family transcriptional regulator n=1 Tax=Devosia sp. YR412 TaxID=1881030 RepID=UPI0008D3155D|nr:BTAD domain-containing putative transcriptional regulator [Devosia sp. YR412]SEQ37672.1 DNA-binding transcriptional activator of the SARP family [Devosia sp. YR412]
MERVPSAFYRITAVLALSSGVVSRTRLGDLFWADAPDGAASANLRQSLARIRQLQQSLQFDLISMDTSRVLLKSTAEVDCDLLALRNILRTSYGGRAVDLCRLYNGDLLSDLPPASSEFEDWLETNRNDLRNRVLEELGAALTEDHTLSPAQRSSCAMQILAIDPYNEEAHRQLMIEAARRGEASLVHSYYNRCRDQLQRELGVSPSLETQELYQRLQRQLVT